MTKAYEVVQDTYDATRPYSVITNLRSYNRVIGRYQTAEKAKRRAANLNRSYAMFERETARNKKYS